MAKNAYHIGRKAGASILHAPRTAAQLGRPLNVHVTINFWQLESTADTIFRDFADLREEWFQRWSGYVPKGATTARNGTPTYAYVHEATHDLPHTHWLLHIAPTRRDDFEAKLSLWLLRHYRLAALPEGALHIEDALTPEGLKKYMVKTLDPHIARLWNIRPEDGGRIAHRRADTSRNIGPSVWRPLKAIYKARKSQQAA